MGITGVVQTLKGLTLTARGLPVGIGALVAVKSQAGDRLAEVIGFESGRAILMLLNESSGVRAGDRVVCLETAPTVQVGPCLLGRVVNGLCEPIDGRPLTGDRVRRLLLPPPVGAMSREPIESAMGTGVRAIDAMTPVGRGQRMGIFAGPGVGKSTLMGMIARAACSAESADVNVIALIGERGREVREFVERVLGPEGLERSVVVVATSDESPLMRVRAAQAACSAAEYFRDRGMDVTLMLDSVTRFAHAQRQIGLAVGEPPATRGYTPSVFAALPVLLERAGKMGGEDSRGGSITGFYTILVEGDDMTEPVADAVRGILDGHLMLSRKLAQRGLLPAIDVLDSISRVAGEISSDEHLEARQQVLSLLAAYRDVEELIQIGAYTRGSSALTDTAVDLMPRIEAFLGQRSGVDSTASEAVEELKAIALSAKTALAARSTGGGGGASGSGRR